MRIDTHALRYRRATRYSLLLVGVLSLALPAATAQTPADTLWSEDWEGDFTENWFVDAGTWEVGEPTSGPGGAYTGQNVAATVLAGNYGQPVDSRLIRFTTFDVPAASEHPRLRFWHWFSFANGDSGEVQVSTDGGETWETLSPVYLHTGSNTWSYSLVDLSGYAGLTMQVAFYFHSVCVNSFCPDVSTGWYIDDMAVISGPITYNNPEGFESGIGDWFAESGTWEIGEPMSGPSSAHTGVNVAGTVLGANYAQPVSSRLISPEFTVPPVSENPALRYWHWFSFANGDSGEIQIREAGGEWETIAGPFANTSSGAWSFFNELLSEYAGLTVQVAFYFHSVCVNSFCPDVSTGWYIDDIEIEGLVDTDVEPSGTASSLNLTGAYPNPSAASTTVAFELPEEADVTLRVFDVLGREVMALEERRPAGAQRMTWEGEALARGYYLYRVEVRMAGGTEVRTGRFTVMR